MSEFAREELHRFAPSKGTAVTIGNFDGVHRGHQHLIRELIDRARALDLAPAAVTLYPDPVRILRPNEPVPYLTSLEERLELLRAAGLEIVVPLTFTSELAELSPEAFVALLRDELGMRLLLMGPDNTFGRNRAASPESMAATGRRLGFEVELLSRRLAEEEVPLSATAIRRALAEGDLDLVTRQLGRYYSLRGPVVRGAGRGRELGFPTANVGVTADRALPALGIYATWACLGEARYPSATSVGTNPTFGGNQPTVEAYVMDFDADVYDRTLRLEFVAWLRPEERFASIEALKTAIGADVEKARRVLATPA